MEFGLAIPHHTANIAAFARRAEHLGFDYIGTGEHILFDSPTTNAFVTLAAAAAVTDRIKLLTAIVPLPLYPPPLVAKMTAVLDVISGGRFNLGVGVGGEYPKEFEAVGVPLSQRGARTDEALQVILRLLGEEEVSFAGRFTRLTAARLLPRPVQQPHPPVWVAGRKEPAMRRAARHGNVWMPYLYTPDQLQRSVAAVRGYCAEFNRPADGVRTGLLAFICADPDGVRAERWAVQTLNRMYGQDFTPLAGRYLVAGTPAYCRQRLQEYADAGAQAVLLSLACPPEAEERVLNTLVSEVIPAWRG